MAANGETVPQGTSEVADVGKGKGKATEPAEITMEDDDDEEESAEEEEVQSNRNSRLARQY
ncbi:hypothetical protein A1O7_04853 [Cladophialophora yegresii CBS 114405]|uniref:Uncharacterized protein n=1 Tax=Cladophialophora yegresii CBS 114405 TaxID=1182544 RepID=W9W6S6_9EURO|nr:uncharacterized protein A1O7_04853 [Cladophialophora yegresii CBS 114405]EXJ60700.1 hypothetical protein A1O7_04853 [Cladophialophora yegresii CBS 114405]